MSNGGTLHTAVRDTARKHLSAGICVELQGLPGSGRSTAARAISAELEDAGWQVLAINGVQALHDRPLEALVIAGVMARQSNPQASTTAVSSAVQGLSSTIRTGSTLVVVDDADQLDGISAGALAAAFAQHHFPVLTVTTTGVEPHPGSLTTSLQPGVTLEVAPLDFVGVQTLLAEALGAPIEPSVVGRTFALSGGVAGIALALAEGARLTEDLRLNDGTWTLRGDLWTPGVGRALAPLLSALTPPQRIGLQTLALAGTVSLETARRLVSGEVLEELDQRGLLRFVIRDDAFLLSVFPLAINEHFTRQGVSMRHLEIAERLTVSMGGALESQPPALGWQGAWTSAPGTSSDTVVNRLIRDHWRRELLLRRSEWQQSPSPRTAAALLAVLLNSGGDLAAVEQLRAATPRSGDPRELVAFDNRYAIFLGAVERDLPAAREVLSASRTQQPQWADLIDAVDTFLVYLLDHCPDPDSLPPLRGIEEPDTRNAMGFVTIELLLARGRSEEALEALQAVNPEEGPFSRTFAATEAYALLLENRLDEALQLALAQLHQARLEHEIEGITGAAYVASQVYLLRGRHGELRGLLGSVLSSGVLSALMRPQMVALTSMAAYAAVEEGRITTARSMAAQAADIGAYPGPFPFSSPTAALAALDGVDLPPAAARALAAERLWSEATEHLGRGYLLSGFVCGLLALSEEPTAARAEVLLTAAKQIPSPLIEEFTDFIEALGSGDHEGQLQVANRHAEAGLIWSATKAYAVALAAMRAAGSAGQAAEAHEEARRRLSVWGDEATAGLRSAADGAELTAREDEIARLAASGLSNQEIARRLLISVRTVENHLHRVFRKLGVDNRTEMSRVLNV